MEFLKPADWFLAYSGISALVNINCFEVVTSGGRGVMAIVAVCLFASGDSPMERECLSIYTFQGRSSRPFPLSQLLPASSCLMGLGSFPTARPQQPHMRPPITHIGTVWLRPATAVGLGNSAIAAPYRTVPPVKRRQSIQAPTLRRQDCITDHYISGVQIRIGNRYVDKEKPYVLF